MSHHEDDDLAVPTSEFNARRRADIEAAKDARDPSLPVEFRMMAEAEAKRLPLLGDSSDRDIKLASGKRVQGATPEEWIELVLKVPDRTLPGGVGGAIVTHLHEELGRVYLKLAEANAPAVALDRLRLQVGELVWNGCFTGDCPHGGQVECDRAIFTAAKRLHDQVMPLPEASPEFAAAIDWHLRAVASGSTAAPSYRHVQAILDHFGYKP